MYIIGFLFGGIKLYLYLCSTKIKTISQTIKIKGYEKE